MDSIKFLSFSLYHPPPRPPSRDPSQQMIVQWEADSLLLKVVMEGVQPNTREECSTHHISLFQKNQQQKNKAEAHPDLSASQYFHQEAEIQHGHTGIDNLLLPEGSVVLNMKDAYFHVDIPPSHRRFLQFKVGQQHYQVHFLTYGLETAPKVFAVVAAHM